MWFFCCDSKLLHQERNLAGLQTQLQELKTSTQAKLAEMCGEHSKELQNCVLQFLGKGS